MSKSTHQRKSRTNVCARSILASGKALPLRRTWPISLCVGLAVGSIVFSGDALAGGPTGGVVVGGTGSITQSGNSTIINQASQKLALNWQTFNVGANESVLFNQPGRSAVALNRILDQNPSQIFGRISSNGQIFLINTHGIIFGATAQMNVGGLLASTLDLTPNDFLAGHYNLNATGAGAGIVNHGLIQAASGGSVALVGGSVLNDGLIFANYGKINLDGAGHAVLDFDGNGLINIQITGELKQRLDQREAAVTNKGTLRAEDGTVVLQASATKDLFTGLVNNTGVIDASGISTDGGVVRLVGNGGNVESSGSINVSGVHGGSAQLLSDRNVGVTGGSIDASGVLGGGDIRVGGGWQGGEGLQTAAATYVAPGAVLKADATQRGDGGSVVVWGNDVNNFYGSISARGGALGGNGGRVETSSHYGLDVHGGVDASAPQGKAGIWLIDPYNVTISSGADANTGTAPNYTASGAGSVVNAGGIGAALTGGTNVFVFTNTAANGSETGNITLSAPISAIGAGSLYLEAVGSILLDSTITGKNAGSPLNVFLWANYGGAAAGTTYSSNAVCATCQVVIGSTASAGITTYGGNVDIRTGDNTNAGGGLQLGSSGTITGSINAGSGSLSVTSTGISQQAAGASNILAGAANFDGGAGAISLANTGNIFSGVVSLHNSGSNAVTLDNGSNALQLGTSSVGSGTLTVNAGSITQNGAITQASAAGAASFNASNAITLNNTGNSFTGAVGLTGSNVSLVNSKATVLGSTTASGTLSVTSNGAMSQTGVLSATGLATFTQNSTTAGATQDIDLGSQNNSLQNGVTFAAGTGAGINNLSLKNTDAAPGTLTLPASVAGNLTLNYTTASLTAPVVSVGGVLDLTAAGGIRIGSNITTTGAQAYHSAVTLGSNATLATTNGNVSFDSTVDNANTTPRNLTVNAGSGAVTFGGAVGGDATNGALGTLAVNSTGTTSFNAAVQAASLTTNVGGSTVLGGNITTSGAQAYNDAVTLGGDVTLATTNNNVSFGNTVDNASTTARNLTVNAGSGAVTFGGAVGGNATNGALGTLAVNSTGTTSFNAAVQAASLTTNVGGSTVLGGNITTSGAQAYNDAVTLGGNVTLATTNNNVSFGNTVDNATTTARNLTVNAGSGAVTFGGAVGGNATNGALGTLAVNSTGTTSFNAAVQAASLTTNVGGSTVLGGVVTTAGTQTYGDAMTLGANATLTGTTVSLAAVTGAGNNLTVTGNAVLAGPVSGVNALQVSGTTNLNTASVSTSGSQTYSGAVTLGVNSTLASSGIGAIGFGSKVDGAHALTVNTGGTTSFGDAVGGTTALTSLTTDTGGSTMLGGNVTTSGAQAYNDVVTLGADATLATTDSNVTFGSTVDNVSVTARKLTVSAGSGAVTFGGALGGGLNGALSGLSVTTTAAAGITQGGAFKVAGTSSFNAGANAITLTNAGNVFTGAVSLAGGNVSLVNSTATILGTTTATGTLDVGSNGALSQNGALTVAGAATFTQNSIAPGTTQDINLGSQNNSLLGGVTFAAGIGAGVNNLSLKNTVASPGALTLPTNVAGILTLNYSNAAATLTVPLAGVTIGGLDLTAGGGIVIDGNVSTSGAQAYHSAVTLGADTVLASSGSGNIGFDSTVNGAYALTVNTGGTTSFGGAVGGTTVLTSLTTDTGGSTMLGGNVATSGAQAYNDAVALGADMTLATVNGAVSFGSTVDNATATKRALTVNAGTGAVTFTGALGNGANGALTSLVTHSGTFNANALNIGSGGLAVTTTAGGIGQGGAFTVAGASSFNAGSGTITLTDAGNDFTGAVSLSNSGANDVAVSDAGALMLGASTIGSGALTLTATGISQTGAIVQAAGGGAVTLDAGAGDLTLTNVGNDFTGPVTASGQAVRITDATALDMVGFTSASNKDVSLVAGGQLTLAPTITVIDTGSGNLTLFSGTSLTTQGNLSGNNVSLTGASGLTLNNDITATGTLTLASSTGGISQAGGNILAGSTSSLSGGTGAVSLASVGNDFTGTVTASGSSISLTDMNALTAALTTGGNAVLTAVGNLAVSGSSNNLTTNAAATSFGATTVGGNLSTTAAGAISQTGTLSVTGSSSLAAGANAITLTDAGNNFTGAVGLSNSGANNVSIRDANGLILGNVSVGTGTLGVQAVGITQAAGTIIVQSAAAGAASFNSGGGAITLANSGNDFTGAVNLTGGTTQITDANALTLGTLATGALTAISTGVLNLGSGTVGGNLAATSNNGAISQSGALAVSGSSTLNAGSGAITLANTGNDFTGAVSLTGGATQITDKNALTLGALGTGALTAISTGALNLGGGNVGGNLAATSNNGAISQSGALAVSGSSTLNAGSGAITLANTGNDFTGAVSLTGGTTQITDANALTLGTLATGALTAISHGALNLGSGTVSGNLAATSNNSAISQGGALAVTGSSTLNAGSAAITLTNTGNNFAGTVNLAGGATQITDASALTLGTLGTGALTAVSHAALNLGSGTVTGNLAATSNNGAIGQTGVLHVTGSSTINAGSAAIALTNASNDFGGAVTATGTGVQITDANNLAIAGLANGANGAVSLIAGGVLTLPAGAIDTGTANLTLVSNGGSLTTPGALSGANVSLAGQGGVTLNSNVTAAGTLNLVSGAAISQGAGIITAGTLTGSSVGNTTLNRANKIGTLGSFSAANFSLVNAQALTVNGPLTTTGNAGDIDLETTGGALVVNANLAADTVALTSAGNLALSKNLQGSTVALVSGGSISQGGGVITAATLSGSAVGSTTLNQANKVAALGAFSSTGFSFTNGQALMVNGPLNGGASVALTTTAGNLAVNGTVSGTTTTLKSAGAISEGASGSITAATLTGQSGGATALNGANHIGTLGSFNAVNFALTNAQALTVSGAVNGGASTALTTTTGDLAINGAVSGTTTTLKSAGAISEGAGGNIVAATLAGQSIGATALNGTNHVGTLGNFSAANFALTNAQALTVSGPVNGGASTALTTTTGDLAINGAVSGTTTTLHSAAAIIEGAGGSITANLLTGHSIGNATLDGNNHINTLGSFTSDFSLTNAQTLTVVGPLDGGPSVALTTTAGDLIINGAIIGTTTTLKSAGTISQGAAGSITASTLTGQSGGATALNGPNHIGTLGSFTAAGFALTNAQALTVDGPVAGGSSTTLSTTAGGLTINGAVSGTQTTLNSAGAISEGSGGLITAATLSGSAAGGTTLGSATHRINNMVDTLGNFSSPAGFSMTNNQTLTLASVAGSAFTVNAGTSAFYLSVTNGDLFQLGTTPVYNGMGTWGSTGRMGTGTAPIYVIGTGLQTVANIGMPPAYFYAVDSGGNLLPLGGGLAVNVPTASGAGSAQNGNHGDSYVDPSVITANYRSYGIVPSGVRLPADQQAGCDPDQPDQLDCEGGDTVGMVRMMMNVRR